MTELPTTAAIKPLDDSIHSIKRSAFRFLSGTALSRMTGMVRDMVLAYAFGTHPALAALFVAFRLSSVCRRLFGEGALQSAFIPYFESLKKENLQRAYTFFRDLNCFMGAFLIVFIIASMALLQGSSWFVSWSSGNSQIVFLTTLLMPTLFFICLFGLNISLLQCHKRYFTAGVTPAYFNISIIIGALWFQSTPAAAAMPSIAGFLILGCFLQWLASFVPAVNSMKTVVKTGLFHHIRLLSSDVKGLAKPLFLGMVGAGASQINNAIDALFARYADPEGPAQLWYALRLQQLPLALFGIALSGALLPPLSRALLAGNEKEYKLFLEFSLRRIVALLLPATLGLVVLGFPLINLVYGRGDFHLLAIVTTTSCLQGYALALVPTGFVIMLAPAFFAQKDYRTPALGAFLALFINCFLNCVMVFFFHWQAVSIAIATGISAWCNALYLWRKLNKNLGPALTQEGGKEVRKTVVISLIAMATVWVVEPFVAEAPSLLWDQVVAFTVPAGVFVLVMYVLARLFRAQDILALVYTTKV